LALQEVRRFGCGKIEFDNFNFVYNGTGSKHGVGILCSKNVEIQETINVLPGRISLYRLKLFGLKLLMIVVYSPTNVADLQEKTEFYNMLNTTFSGIKIHEKVLVLGDDNSTIGDDSRQCQAFNEILGPNNPNTMVTNENGQLLLEFAVSNKLKILNSIFKSKRCHRYTYRVYLLRCALLHFFIYKIYGKECKSAHLNRYTPYMLIKICLTSNKYNN